MAPQSFISGAAAFENHKRTWEGKKKGKCKSLMNYNHEANLIHPRHLGYTRVSKKNDPLSSSICCSLETFFGLFHLKEKACLPKHSYS